MGVVIDMGGFVEDSLGRFVGVGALVGTFAVPGILGMAKIAVTARVKGTACR